MPSTADSPAPLSAAPPPAAPVPADAFARCVAAPDQIKCPDMTKAWWPKSLAGGAVGVALLHIERARRGIGGWDAAHAWLTVAARDHIATGAPGCLFEGGPAVAFAVNAAADTPGKYAHALVALDTYITDMTRQRLQDAHARIAAGRPTTLIEYDLIFGLTGIGSYLLRREQHHPLLAEVLSYLVALTKPLRIAGRAVPGWWTETGPTGRTSPDFPAGHGNLGMAHGIAGPLALLATAMRRGAIVDGHAEAIGTICAWLDQWRQDGPNGPWWPEWITAAELHDRRVHRVGPHRPSWCYGTPGLARAQQLAALATGDAARQHRAEQALARCLADPAQLDRITDDTICHGTAGVFQTAWRAASEAASPAIADQLPHLRGLLPGTLSTANLGLLNGAAGVALALETAATDTAPASEWDACLLIA
jgi:hypothetical protein